MSELKHSVGSSGTAEHVPPLESLSRRCLSRLPKPYTLRSDSSMRPSEDQRRPQTRLDAHAKSSNVVQDGQPRLFHRSARRVASVNLASCLQRKRGRRLASPSIVSPISGKQLSERSLDSTPGGVLNSRRRVAEHLDTMVHGDLQRDSVTPSGNVLGRDASGAREFTPGYQLPVVDGQGRDIAPVVIHP